MCTRHIYILSYTLHEKNQRAWELYLLPLSMVFILVACRLQKGHIWPQYTSIYLLVALACFLQIQVFVLTHCMLPEFRKAAFNSSDASLYIKSFKTKKTKCTLGKSATNTEYENTSTESMLDHHFTLINNKDIVHWPVSDHKHTWLSGSTIGVQRKRQVSVKKRPQ